MKYCVSNWIYYNEPLQLVMQRAKTAGCNGLELMGEPQIYDTDEVCKLIDKYELPIFSVAGIFTPERDLSALEPKIRDQAIEYCIASLDFAKAIGAQQLVVLPSYVYKVKPDGDIRGTETWNIAHKRDWKNIVEAMRRVVDHAEKKGIILAIEPLNRYETYLINTLAQVLVFIQEINAPCMRIQLDTFHMNIEEIEPWNAIRKAGNLLVSMHLSDSNRMALGHGNLDFRGMMRALKEIRFDGLLTLEPLVPCPNPNVAMLMTEDKKLLESILEDSLATLRVAAQTTQND